MFACIFRFKSGEIYAPKNAATYAVRGVEQFISCDTDWERARLLMGCETGLIRECVGVVLAHISPENG